MAKDRLYCGNAKFVQTRYGDIVKVSLCLDDIPEEEVYVSEKTGKRYVTVDVKEMRSQDRFGNTHSVEVNTYKPDSKRTGTRKSYRDDSGSYQQGGPESFDDDQIPF